MEFLKNLPPDTHTQDVINTVLLGQITLLVQAGEDSLGGCRNSPSKVVKQGQGFWCANTGLPLRLASRILPSFNHKILCSSRNSHFLWFLLRLRLMSAVLANILPVREITHNLMRVIWLKIPLLHFFFKQIYECRVVQGHTSLTVCPMSVLGCLGKWLSCVILRVGYILQWGRLEALTHDLCSCMAYILLETKQLSTLKIRGSKRSNKSVDAIGQRRAKNQEFPNLLLNHKFCPYLLCSWSWLFLPKKW